MFTLQKSTPIGRLGTLRTLHGDLSLPLFMPVGTAGAMKGLTHEHLCGLGAEILLSNTYHLHLHPGEDLIAEAGGIHRFVSWDLPMITDSGGYQVFSLRGISEIDDDGVEFRSHRSGEKRYLSPEDSIRIQHKLGADIILNFDHCPPSKASRDDVTEAMERTLRWARRCKDEHVLLSNRTGHKPLLFGIVQGGLERDLRQKCAEELQSIGFDGYAIGGLAVGETPEEMFDVLEDVCPLLPEDAPRYLMGVGRIDQFSRAIALGVDMFDCVLPMREARHGRLYTADGTVLRMTNAAYFHDHSPIDVDSPSPLSRLHTKSYLHHLLKLGERYGETIACMQNIAVTLQHLRSLRRNIESLE